MPVVFDSEGCVTFRYILHPKHFAIWKMKQVDVLWDICRHIMVMRFDRTPKDICIKRTDSCTLLLRQREEIMSAELYAHDLSPFIICVPLLRHVLPASQTERLNPV